MKRQISTMLGMVAALSFALPAAASVIALTPTGGNPGDDIPLIGTGPGNGNDPVSNFHRLATHFNSSDFCTLPDQFDAANHSKPASQTNDFSAGGLAGWDFAVLHYGAGRGGTQGSGGGIAAYYLGGMDSFVFPSDGNGPNGFGGFSSIDLYRCADDPGPGPGSGVPDSGSTLILLGSALVAFPVVRRCLRAK